MSTLIISSFLQLSFIFELFAICWIPDRLSAQAVLRLGGLEHRHLAWAALYLGSFQLGMTSRILGVAPDGLLAQAVLRLGGLEHRFVAWAALYSGGFQPGMTSLFTLII